MHNIFPKKQEMIKTVPKIPTYATRAKSNTYLASLALRKTARANCRLHREEGSDLLALLSNERVNIDEITKTAQVILVENVATRKHTNNVPELTSTACEGSD